MKKINTFILVLLLPFIILFLASGLIYSLNKNRNFKTEIGTLKKEKVEFTKKVALKLKEIARTKEEYEKEFLLFVESLGEYKKTGSSAQFLCLEGDEMPRNKKIASIKDELSRENRVLEQVCINKNDIIAISKKRHRRH